ncbi:MAG: M20/M25/M40 family metallo-hydrolase [bacterium]
MINERRLINAFKALVKIESLSLQEKKAAAYVQKELRALGLPFTEVGKLKSGEVGSLITTLPGEKGPVILLNAHIDTVGPGKNIKPIEKKGYIYSDGSTILGADNKAGVAAILEILRNLKEKKIKHPPLRVVFTVAEELGLVGAKAIPAKYLKADLGLVLDGGDIDKIVNKAPSQQNITATIIGKAAHAGIHPEDGINSIKVASEAIAAMKLGRIDSETTANIGIIQGGKATNIIPDEVFLKGEARSHDPKKLARQVAQMKQTLVRATKKHSAKLRLEIKEAYKSFEIKKKNKIMSLVMAGMKGMGITPVIRETGGGSDANIFNGLGIPCLILGVGADHVHTKREQIKVADLVRGTEMILNILKEAVEWKRK